MSRDALMLDESTLKGRYMNSLGDLSLSVSTGELLKDVVESSAAAKRQSVPELGDQAKVRIHDSSLPNATMIIKDKIGNEEERKAITMKRYSMVSRSNPNHFDRYGFKKQTAYVTEVEYDHWWDYYSTYCYRRKQKWERLFTQLGLPVDDAPTSFPSRGEKLKRYVRKGIPAEWRGNAWWHFARGDEKLSKNKGVYDKLLLQLKHVHERKDFEVIERDLYRTFPDNIHFYKEPFQNEDPHMIQSLRRILRAFSIYDENIGYCQSLNFIAGLLLLFMDEEKAFWMLVIITKQYLPKVHSMDLEGVNIDQGVLVLCIKQYLPDIWREIETSYVTHNAAPSNIHNEYLYRLPPITLSTASWFMSCFIGVVPIETTLRIWDCLFYEKSHILFKISLGLLKLSEDELLGKKHINAKQANSFFGSETTIEQAYSQEDRDILMFQVIQTFPRKLIDPNELFDRILSKNRIPLNKMGQEEIDRCRKYVAGQRNKLRYFDGALAGSTVGLSSNKGIFLEDEAVNEILLSELFDYDKNSFSGISWNNRLKERVRRMKLKK
ncbi:hypothetical protein KAFR_0C01590 [Kazachstania africana CBS 2517]|uniref:Rab-GAP TBC domain-containing protein n=1 Tax=Kazachstania africana (strain ATCC 22294 / BCRC 22015 / CBS 2517 / CECT 1963 / NBRC 1671 / NRRL Y-8276) TaxID=1071382 RepID=H2AS02_KAZAF|nr:hypothetical protein KAFR_0C01590 [Kazachstania africana CBS 2517]CCF57152.1 hypothetical protein KAFR_0C01590 [Kazachstania africana CBS 2517]